MTSTPTCPRTITSYIPTRALWPAASVNARLPPVKAPDGDPELKAAAWLDRNRAVQQMTWAPGKPLLIADLLMNDGGWIQHAGAACFNQYLPPVACDGDPDKAGRWVEHVRRVYPDDALHILNWLGHRVQQPGEKINHALVLGGGQGIGKDTILAPVKAAVGPWNFREVSPRHLLEDFNPFVKSVILRISEARDLGDGGRFAFYDHMKTYTAAPPDMLLCNEKHRRAYSVPNVCGVVITTNYKEEFAYLPPDDRRHYVAWSEAQREDFEPDYWNGLYT